MLEEEVGIFAGEDVVGDEREGVCGAEEAAEGEEEGGFSGADGADWGSVRR